MEKHMSEITISDIKIIEIKEHEDGSATLELELDEDTRNAIFNFGFVELMKRGLESEEDKDD